MKSACLFMTTSIAIAAITGCAKNGPSNTPDPMGNPDPNLRHQPLNGASPDMSSGGPATAPAADPLRNLGTSQQNGGSSSPTGTSR